MSQRSSQFPVLSSQENRTFCVVAGHRSLLHRSSTIRFLGGNMRRSYRDLIGWQKAIKFVTEIREVIQRFPRSPSENCRLKGASATENRIVRTASQRSPHEARRNARRGASRRPPSPL